MSQFRSLLGITEVIADSAEISNIDLTDTVITGLTTTNVAEGKNLYFTDTRVNNNSNVSSNTTHRGLTNNPHSVSAAQVGIDSTDDITEGFTNLYYTDARFDTRFELKTTADLAEGTNLYYTVDRFEAGFDSRLLSKTTDDLKEGLTNLYYTTTRVNTDFNARLVIKTTDDLKEGLTNLYYTTARVNTDFDTRLLSKSTDDLSEGLTNLYYTDTRVNNNSNVSSNSAHIGLTNNPHSVTASQVGINSTDDIKEGLTNLYYTELRVSGNTDVVANTAYRNVGHLPLTGGTMTGDIIFDMPTTFNMPYSSPAEYAPTASTGSGATAPSQAFNGNTTDSSWFSVSNVYDPNDDYAYIGTVETSIDGKLTGGEWIQIQSTAAKLRITSIDLRAPFNAAAYAPEDFILCVSDDNVEFTSILSVTGAALGNGSTVYGSDVIYDKNAYYFRIVVTRTNNAPRTGLAQWFITFTEALL